MSSSAPPTILAVKYILDREVLQFMTHNHSRLISSEVIAYNELTTQLYLYCKPVRIQNQMANIFLFHQMMGLVF